MSAFAIPCPECKAVLRSAKPIPAGTVLTCPKCETMFPAPKLKPKPKPAPVPAAVAEEDEILEAVEIIDENQPVEPPKPKRKRPKVEFRKKSQVDYGKWVSIGVGSFLGLLALGAAVWGFMFVMKQSGGTPLGFVPGDSMIFAGADLNKLIKDTPAGSYIEMFFNNSEQFGAYRREADVEWRDILDKVAIGFTNGGNGPTGAIAIKTTKAIDKEKMGKVWNGKATTIGGKSAFTMGPDQMQTVYFQPSSTVAVFAGTPSALAERIVNSSGPAFLPEKDDLLKKASAGHAWLFIDMVNSEVQNSLGKAGLPKEMADLFRETQALAVWLTVKGDEIEFTTAVLAHEPGHAQKILNVMTKSDGGNQNLLTALPAFLQPAGLKEMEAEAKASQQSKLDGKTAIITQTVKMATVQKLVDSMGRFMMPPPPGGRGGRGGRG